MPMNARDRLQIDKLGRPSISEWCDIMKFLADEHTSLDRECASMIDLLMDIEQQAHDDWLDDVRLRRALEEKVAEGKP